MAAVTTGKEKEEFLKECTPCGEDGYVKFQHKNVQGLFRDVPEYCGQTWAIRILTEPQDWLSSSLPDSFPAKAKGNFCFLIEKTAFSLADYPNCLTQDFLSPWDLSPSYTRCIWYQKATEHGIIKLGLSINAKDLNIQRYITYFADNHNRPLSNILFQYVVSELKESQKKENVIIKIVPPKTTTVQKKEEKVNVNAPAISAVQQENTAPVIEEITSRIESLVVNTRDTTDNLNTPTMVQGPHHSMQA